MLQRSRAPPLHGGAQHGRSGSEGSRVTVSLLYRYHSGVSAGFTRFVVPPACMNTLGEPQG
jgi:hypothetical protein